MAWVNRLWATAQTVFPYHYSRRALPGPGSMNLAFLSINLPHYNIIGGGNANWDQIRTMGAQNLRPLIGWVGPGGNLTGQVFNPPLYPSTPQSPTLVINGVGYVPGSIVS